MKITIAIFLGLIVNADLAIGFTPAQEHENTKPGNVINTMMLEQVEEATEDFNEVVVENPKQKKGFSNAVKDSGKKLKTNPEKPFPSHEAAPMSNIK